MGKNKPAIENTIRHSSFFIRHSILGQSVVEVVVAVAIFVIIAGGSVVAVLGSLSTSRLAEEETQATAYAVEGIEAVQSIRNKDWNDLVDGDHGLTNAGDVWAFSETSETIDKFTRVVNVSSVLRDENDDIVDLGGDSDPNTKKITSTITWDFTASRTNLVEKVAYLTNWQEAYGSGAVSAPTPTSTPIPTSTPVPPSTCSEYCVWLGGYVSGACRQHSGACLASEVYESGGDALCTGGPSADTCCCQ